VYLKIMSEEDAPDGDSRKTFRILADVLSVEFTRDPLYKTSPKAKDAKAVVCFRTRPRRDLLA